jgi:hypothetical protein
VSGPEHYREAERLLNITAATGLPSVRMEQVALAQVHATLALAAATAAEQATAYDGDEDSSRTRGWAGVA